MISATKHFYSHIAIATWILCALWSLPLVTGAPMPQAEDGGSSSTNTTLDPFATPEYLAPSKFTWEQCIYGILFLSLGGVEVLHGYKYIRFTMLLAGFLVWSSTAVMIMIIVNVNSGSYQSSGVYFAVWLLVGIVGAIASFYLWHVGIILTGAYGMFVLVAVIFTAAKVQNYAFRYAFLAVCVVAGGYLTKRYERYAVIIATSFGGAYCMMFGLDMFVQDQFRTTFHVILSQSSAAFYPDAGTWVMVAFVPVIAALGIVWELKHHEEPVGSWWFGHGARPLPPLPGEKPARKCCGITMARSAKDAEKSAGDSTAALTNGSDATLVQSPTTASYTWHWASGLNTCCGKRGKTAAKLGAQDSSTTAAVPGTDDLSSTGAVDAMTPTSMETVFENDKAVPSDATEIGGGSKSHPLPVEKENYGEGHETIGHTGVHKVVIQREVREFSLDVDERL